MRPKQIRKHSTDGNVTVGKDSWAAEFLLIPGLLFVAYLWLDLTDRPAWTSLSIAIIKFAAVIGFIYSMLEILKLRFRRAASIFVGITLMSLSAYFCSNTLFEARLTKFDQIVETQRNSLNNIQGNTVPEPSKILLRLE